MTEQRRICVYDGRTPLDSNQIECPQCGGSNPSVEQVIGMTEQGRAAVLRDAGEYFRKGSRLLKAGVYARVLPVVGVTSGLNLVVLGEGVVQGVGFFLSGVSMGMISLDVAGVGLPQYLEGKSNTAFRKFFNELKK